MAGGVDVVREPAGRAPHAAGVYCFFDGRRRGLLRQLREHIAAADIPAYMQTRLRADLDLVVGQGRVGTPNIRSIA